MIESSKAFGVYDCICRKQKDLIGARKCDFPLDICMRFTRSERLANIHDGTPNDFMKKHDISKEEALALLDKAEKVGLVHTVSNVMEGLTYMCNCCICCCGVLQNSSAVSNYFSTIDPESCTGCGVCEKRCQVNAISLKDNVAVVDLEKCIGCGLCVTGCTVSAARLQLKPENKRVDPPKDFRTWEDKRLQNRGLH
ncbi:MAG: 4Fe-4S binding protein [Candidatus Bathyarchaeota archaeon]|nr:4Fe-4S binding protein [Candidatus Bathyarchaeota archaeon]